MDKLWSPWRMAYIKAPRTDECIFCVKANERNDKKNLVVMRGELVFVIMNLYPYNTGHLMVSPYRHIGDLSALTDEELFELIRYTKFSVELLRKALRPDGFNIGINMGKVAGAGIEAHIHIHVVPRWTGDTNFMPVIADTKVIPEYLEETYSKLVENLPEGERSKILNDR